MYFYNFQLTNVTYCQITKDFTVLLWQRRNHSQVLTTGATGGQGQYHACFSLIL